MTCYERQRDRDAVAVGSGLNDENEHFMIRLTRISKEPFILNAELIRYVEARPDTFITLTSGERLVVLETMDEVLERTLAYQRQKHLFPSIAK
jgi:flagellar protein FlbD